MQILIKRRRTPVVPIVPLIDILAILLIFFMLTTTFKERRDLLPIDLPRVTNLSTEQSAERRVTLEVSETGEMRLGDAPVPSRALAGALRKMKEQLPGAQLELRADNRISLQVLLEIWEALASAGFAIGDVPVRVQQKVN